MLDAEAWVATAFLMFIGVLAYLGVYRKVAAALDRRQALIKTKLDEARLLREEAQAVLVAYQSKQREGMREAEAIIGTAKTEAEQLASEANAKLEDFVARRTKLAQTKIAQAEAKAISEVRSAAADTAIAAAEKLLRQIVKNEVPKASLSRTIEQLRVNN